MKIGLLTFHYVCNLGSVLQTLCGYRILEKTFPKAQIEVIDLMPAKRLRGVLHDVAFFARSRPFIRFDKPKRYLDLQRALRRRVRLSPRCLHSDLEKQITFINAQNYDWVVTGSDTVWMHSEKLGNALPSVYFLPEGIRARRASIAASADPLRAPEGYHAQQTRLCELYKAYEFLSVRDSTTTRLLADLGVPEESIVRLADPVFMHPFEEELGLPRGNERWTPEGRRVAVALQDQILSRKFQAILKERGFEPVNLYAKKDWKRDLFRENILDCIGSDALVTDRFHYCVIALKLSNIPVINVEDTAKHPLPNSKGRDLLEALKLPECLYRGGREDAQGLFAALVDRMETWSESEMQRRFCLVQSFIDQSWARWNGFWAIPERDSSKKAEACHD